MLLSVLIDYFDDVDDDNNNNHNTFYNWFISIKFLILF